MTVGAVAVVCVCVCVCHSVCVCVSQCVCVCVTVLHQHLHTTWLVMGAAVAAVLCARRAAKTGGAVVSV
jgi:hypothetical protein